jgi:hypothetical protein
MSRIRDTAGKGDEKGAILPGHVCSGEDYAELAELGEADNAAHSQAAHHTVPLASLRFSLAEGLELDYAGVVGELCKVADLSKVAEPATNKEVISG